MEMDCLLMSLSSDQRTSLCTERHDWTQCEHCTSVVVRDEPMSTHITHTHTQTHAHTHYTHTHTDTRKHTVYIYTHTHLRA